MISKTTTATSTIAVMLVPLGGPPLLALVSGRLVRSSPGMPMQMLSESIMWIFLAFVLFVVVYIERRPLSSIGLRPPGWSTVVSGL